ncbi:hypothetical protein MC885_012909, partial [Smutsia gigantea]
ERLRKQFREVAQPLSEQIDQPLPEEPYSIEQALSQEHSSIDQPQARTTKDKEVTSSEKAQEKCDQVQAKCAEKKEESERRK